MKPGAIIWDYDGTLVDSAVKNRIVTIELLRRFDADIEKHLPAALGSLEAYRQASAKHASWRDTFMQEFGCTAAQVAEIDRIWRAGQLADPLQPPLFCGLRDVLPALAQLAPMGICSRNSSGNIRATLHRYGIGECFGAVIGCTEVAVDEQKPHPAGMLACLAALGVRGDAGPILVIGDHAADVQYAHAGKAALASLGISAQVICITTRFGESACVTSTGADACAGTPQELLTLIQKLYS